MFRDSCRLSKAKHLKKGKPEIYRISKTDWSSAQVSQKPVGAARRSLLEQRATGELSTPRPIGAARKSVRNLLEQRAGKDLSTEKPIGVARRTYWSSAQISQKPIGVARRWVKTYWS